MVCRKAQYRNGFRYEKINNIFLYKPTRSVLCSFYIISCSLNHRGIYLDKKNQTETMTLKTCRECGECCRHFAFAKLSQLEIETIEAFTGLHFSIFTYPIGADGEDGDHFGLHIDLSSDGSILAVGSSRSDLTYSDQGSVYVFAWDSGSSKYKERYKLFTQDGSFEDILGSGVALSSDGSIVISGSNQKTINENTKQGAVFVYRSLF